ncbi:EAL domain-containing protein [Luteimonas soli]|uniref:EAL domain-containing protein n=1 Tax=Luteimonas soli TaxID=1648966 RepID=A0ABV7XI42_9GAMM
MRRSWCLAGLHAIALLMLALAWPAAASDGASGTLRVGGDANYPPYQFIDEDGRADGFDIALARAVADDLGLEPRIELGEWDDTLDRLTRGELDLVPMFWSAEREQHYLFTQPFLIRHHALFGRRGQPELESLDELANVRVAVQRAGLAAEALRKQAGSGVTLLELDTESGTLVAVDRGEADYALAPTGIGYYTINRNALHDVIALSPPLLERKYVFAMPRARADLVPRIDASLERLRADGVLNDLYVEWIGNLNPHTSRPWRMVAAGLAALLVIGFFGHLWWRRSRPAAPGDDDPALIADLRDAIAGGRLDFMLQPKLDLRSGRWVGAELLVRWNHPQRGPLAPDEFVPMAEQARVIGTMNLHLLRCGLQQRRQWPQAEPPLHLSVNVSANDLADAQLVDDIIDACGQAGTGLMLEVTETDVMREPERVAEALPRLREHGIRIAVDDFGAGHSSLVNLRRLAPDELKIDKSFVASLLNSRSDQAIVTAIVGLAHELGATVAAEGIEDEATQRWLADAGCDVGQGFGIARPMTAGEFTALLVAQQAANNSAQGGPEQQSSSAPPRE